MAHEVTVEVTRTGRRFEATAVLDLAADATTVWETITDYGALPRFMPGIRACRVVQREALHQGDERLVVEQEGEFRFLMFSQAMTVVLGIENLRLRVSEAKAQAFDLGMFGARAIDEFEGRYELTALATRGKTPRTQLRYTSLIALRLPPPPAIGSAAVRQNLAAQLHAVSDEIARRSRRGASAPVRP
jgi:hypothetical protein